MNASRHTHFRNKPGAHTLTALVILLFASSAPLSRGIEARIKDIARIDGLTGVQLVGYGIVVGLSGTGDKDLMMTKQTMANLFQQFQIKLPTSDIKSKNVAAVMVTALAPPFHRSGDHLDVQVSSIGDATSLEGGILLMTPLLDPDGKLYALAQGGLTIGGYSAGAAGPGGQTETKNYTTVGIVPGGAALRENQADTFLQNGSFRLVLLHADFTTASRMASVINATNEGTATARDAGSVLVRVPPDVLDVGQVASFVAGIEALTVSPDSQSRIIVNERTGTIVMGGNVHIGEAIVAHGNLTVSVGSTLSAYMPNSMTEAKPVVTEKITTGTKEDKAKVILVPGTVTVQELADALNQMGSTPRDLISILEALHRLGAIQMEMITL
jgi:flagellar P-ring protein FlgI